MGMFNIKLKTKNGNDIKKKENVTVYFMLRYTKGLKATAQYTFRIVHSRGSYDSVKIHEIKDSHLVKSIEDLTLKVLLNLYHVVAKISQKYDMNPDMILFISSSLGGSNKSYRYLVGMFDRTARDTYYTEEYYRLNFKINYNELVLLQEVIDTNKFCKFKTLDPSRTIKHEKASKVCEFLQRRLNGELEVYSEPQEVNGWVIQ